MQIRLSGLLPAKIKNAKNRIPEGTPSYSVSDTIVSTNYICNYKSVKDTLGQSQRTFAFRSIILHYIIEKTDLSTIMPENILQKHYYSQMFFTSGDIMKQAMKRAFPTRLLPSWCKIFSPDPAYETFRLKRFCNKSIRPKLQCCFYNAFVAQCRKHEYY